MPMIDPERAAHMEALANELDRTVDRLNAALARQEELVLEVGQIRRRNRWLVAATVAGFLVAVGATVAALTAFNAADDVRELNAAQDADRLDNDARLCNRTVATRQDNRAMWLWLIDRVDGESALAAEARVTLDDLLPQLECDATNHPVPIVAD